jgi:hypothetical protein
VRGASAERLWGLLSLPCPLLCCPALPPSFSPPLSLSLLDPPSLFNLQVEWIAMRAMSVGLIKGSLDQVAQQLNISFIKPRVLSRQQLTALKDKVDQWREKTQAALNYVEERASKELFA